MTAEPVPEPGHPLYALTTSELRDYRRDLEQALAAAPGHRPLQDKLAEVQAEQESRARITGRPT
jgi:hypothetical protein